MSRQQKQRKPPPLSVPEDSEQQLSYSFSDSGTFKDGDLALGNAWKAEIQPIPEETGSESGEKISGVSTPNSHAEKGEGELSIADLEILGSLGEGSSGTVKKVRHIPTGRTMALKMIPLDVNEQTRKQILMELRTLHESQCPYIISFNGAFYSEGAVSMALEYMDAGSLADIVKAIGGVSEDVLCHITTQVLKGLVYLHKERHLIHRDVKPSNLLVNMKGDVKISDFGVSGKLASSISKAVSWVGTATYMSPERIRGNQYSYDSDIWSLGLTLVELALGRFPYVLLTKNKHVGFWDLLAHIVEEPPPILRRDRFSAELCSFVASCLKKRPEDRPTSSSLLEHPFIKRGPKNPVDMEGWIKATMFKIKSRERKIGRDALKQVEVSGLHEIELDVQVEGDDDEEVNVP